MSKAKAIIHFAHSNGFPGSCYKSFFDYFKEEYELSYSEMLGHDPNLPITNNWPNLVIELKNDIEKHHQQPVVGLGHSLGGVLMYMLCVQHPELFQSVIMIDAPVLPKLKCRMLRIAKFLNIIDKITPAGRTKYRTRRFTDHAAAKAYFKKRSFFKSFSESALDDYINYGLLEDDAGVYLKFDPELEYQIYRGLTHDANLYLRDNTVPVYLLRATNSYVISERDATCLKKQYFIHPYDINGGHMIPFENPDVCAQVIKDLIARDVG